MKLFSTAAAAALLIALLPNIGAAATYTDPDFARLDTNGDGLISWPEYASQNPVSGRIDPRLIFDSVDTNGDGYVDPAEFEVMQQRRRR